jgi:hypothetical protein
MLNVNVLGSNLGAEWKGGRGQYATHTMMQAHHWDSIMSHNNITYIIFLHDFKSLSF